MTHSKSCSSRVLAISGSSAQDSINQALLLHAGSLLEDVEVDYVSVLDFPAPIFRVDLEKDGVPKTMLDLYTRIQAADALIIASPEHNGSMPAMLKNVVDWLSRVKPGQKFLPKPLLLLSTSPGGRGGRTNLEHMSVLAPRWGADVIATCSLGRFRDIFDQEEGRLVDEDAIERLGSAIALFSEAVGSASSK